MIPLVPYKQLVFESPLSKEEVIHRLTLEVTKPRSGLQWLETRTEKFQGTVSEEGFHIKRIIHYRNSFLPIIHGRFSPMVQGVRLKVTMKIHIVALVFLLIWVIFVGRMVEVGGAVLCALLIFFYLIVTIAFEIEANKASKLLSRVFEADDFRVKKA